jgi:hypothetical protein
MANKLFSSQKKKGKILELLISIRKILNIWTIPISMKYSSQLRTKRKQGAAGGCFVLVTMCSAAACAVSKE